MSVTCSFPSSKKVSQASLKTTLPDNKKSFWAHSLTRQRHLKSKQKAKREQRRKKKTFSARQTQFSPKKKEKTLSRSLFRDDTTISSSAAGTTTTVDSTTSSAGRERPRSLCRLPHDPFCGSRPHRIRVPYLPNAADASAGAHAQGGGGQQRGSAASSSSVRSGIAAVAGSGARH